MQKKITFISKAFRNTEFDLECCKPLLWSAKRQLLLGKTLQDNRLLALLCRCCCPSRSASEVDKLKMKDETKR